MGEIALSRSVITSPAAASGPPRRISIGVPANEQYGIRGISSGRMPHFGAVLSKTDIESIMAYERSL